MQHTSGPFLALNHPKNRSRRLLRTRGESMGSELIRECFLSGFGPDFVFFRVSLGPGRAGSCGRAPSVAKPIHTKTPLVTEFFM